MTGSIIRSLRSIQREIAKSLEKRGLFKTIHWVVETLLIRLSQLVSPAKRKATISKRQTDLAFDRLYGVDTSGIIRLSNLQIKNNNWIYGQKYEASNPEDFVKVLKNYPIQYEDFTFVDFGSGKGRVVLLASQFPFKNIIGVEFSEELNAIAKNNFLRYPKEAMNCKNIEFLCIDAVKFSLPEDPLVLYFFNPFERPVMAKVINKINAQWIRVPRRIIVIYFTPKCGDLFEKVEMFEKVMVTDELSIYDTGPHEKRR